MATFAEIRVEMDDWKTCTARTVRKYALTTKEPSESVVEAALGECSVDYHKVENTLRSAEGGSFMKSDDIDSTMKALVDHWRPELIAGVFRLRANQNRK